MLFVKNMYCKNTLYVLNNIFNLLVKISRFRFTTTSTFGAEDSDNITKIRIY